MRDLLDLPRLFKFGTTGLAGFIVDFGVLVLCHSGLRLSLQVSTLLSYSIGGVVHYSLTRFWVFPQAKVQGEVGRIGRYLALGAFNALVTLALITGMVEVGLDYRPAKIIAVALLFFTNYLLTPRLVMTSPGRRTSAPASRARSRNSR